jgi:hypothetical protein
LSDTGVISADRWRDNWRVLASPDAAHVELSRSPRRRRAQAASVRDLPSGSPVALSASAPRAASRCRAFAADAGLRLERQYLAFPTAAAPAYLVEDAHASTRLFATAVLVAPPRTRLSVLVDTALTVLRAAHAWRLIRVLAPGRMAVGRRI